MLGERRYGALTIVEQAHAKDEIQRRLQALDPRLFVELERTLEGEDVWTVCLAPGSEQMPFPIYEQRDEHGRPIPYLTERCVEEIQRRMRQPVTVRSIHEHNARVRAERDLEFEQNQEAVTEEFVALKGRVGAVHRSRGLQLARQRGRRRGPDVELA